MESTVEDGPRLKHFRSALQKMLLASMKQCTYRPGGCGCR